MTAQVVTRREQKPTLRYAPRPHDPENPWLMTWFDPQTGPDTFFYMPTHKRAIQFLANREWTWPHFSYGWPQVFEAVKRGLV